MFKKPIYKENIKSYLDVLEWREKKEWKEWRKKIATMSNPDWDLADKSQFSPFPFKNNHVSRTPLPQTSKHPNVFPSDKPTIEQAYEYSTPFSLRSDSEPDVSWQLDADDSEPDVYWGPNSDDNSLLFSQIISPSKEEKSQGTPDTIVDDDINHSGNKSQTKSTDTQPGATSENTPENGKKRSYPRDESSSEAVSYGSKKLKAGDRLPLATCFLGNPTRRKNSHKNQPLPGKENKPHKSPNISSTHNFFGCGENQPLASGSVKKPIKEEQRHMHDKAHRKRNK